jgi:hypothetical protein
MHVDASAIGGAPQGVAIFYEADSLRFADSMGLSPAGGPSCSGRLPPGRYVLHVAPLYEAPQAIQVLPVTIRDGEDTDVYVRLRQGVPCVFRVQTPARAILTVQGTRGLAAILGAMPPDGSEQVEVRCRLEPGRYTVTARTDGGAKATAELEVSAERAVEVELQLR